jgi:hypothetical protein
LPEIVKYGRPETFNMVIVLEALRNCDIGLNATSLACPLPKYIECTSRYEQLFCYRKYLRKIFNLRFKSSNTFLYNPHLYTK